MLSAKQLKQRRRSRTRYQVRKFANGKVRLSVFRSSKHIYAQIIDDARGHTVTSACSLDKSLTDDAKATTHVNMAQKVGALLATRAIDAGVKTVVFDRGAYKYHGRIKALADAARAGGLQF